MNITYIKAPPKSNIGNGFFSDGGEYIIKKIINPKHNISIITHNESIKISKELIEQTDMFILGWGCVLTEVNWNKLLYPIINLNKRIIALGFGCTYYNSIEKRISIEFAKHCELMTTRDNYLYEYVQNETNTINGIDSAFFCTEYYDKEQGNEDYCVSNIDDTNIGKTTDDIQLVHLLKQYPTHNQYVTCNQINTHKQNIKYKNISDCKKLWNFYANAECVSTTRAHTAICCLSEKTKVNYYGHMDKRALGMFEACDIDLSKNTTNINEAFEKIVKRKNKYLEELKNHLSNI